VTRRITNQLVDTLCGHLLPWRWNGIYPNDRRVTTARVDITKALAGQFPVPALARLPAEARKMMIFFGFRKDARMHNQVIGSFQVPTALPPRIKPLTTGHRMVISCGGSPWQRHHLYVISHLERCSRARLAHVENGPSQAATTNLRGSRLPRR
jgi:hypothetical protein